MVGAGSSTAGATFSTGIDFFIGKNGEISITEINARWTGGLFPAEILTKINNKRDAIPFFDVVPLEKKESFIRSYKKKIA